MAAIPASNAVAGTRELQACEVQVDEVHPGGAVRDTQPTQPLRSSFTGGGPDPLAEGGRERM